MKVLDAPLTSNSAADRPTREAYDDLLIAYRHFNDELFEGKLPGALITLQRNKRFLGFFSRRRFVSARTNAVADELAMNPSAFAVMPIEEVLSTLVHELCHQHQYHFGDAGRRGYHNRAFADLMKSIGLQTSDTGMPGGKEVGERMSHFILADGPFITSARRLLATDFALSWLDRYPMAVCRISQGEELDDDEDPGEEPPPSRPPSAAAEIQAPLFVIESDQVQDSSPDTPRAEVGGAGGRPTAEPLGEPPALAGGSPERLTAPPITAGLDIEMPGTGGAEPTRKTRYKFVCPECSDAAWGKPSLHLICGKCSKRMAAVDLPGGQEQIESKEAA